MASESGGKLAAAAFDSACCLFLAPGITVLTASKSKTHRKAYAWTAEAFAGELEALKRLVADLESLEAEAENLGFTRIARQARELRQSLGNTG